MSKDIHFLRIFVHIPACSTIHFIPIHMYSKDVMSPATTFTITEFCHSFRHERQIKTIHLQMFKGHLNIFFVNYAFLFFAKFSWTCLLFLYWFISALPPKQASIHTSKSPVATPYQQNINKNSQSQYMVEPCSNFPDSKVQALPTATHRMLLRLQDWEQALQNCCLLNHQVGF